jgi:hypothetical protein
MTEKDKALKGNDLLEQVCAILLAHDPIGIDYADNPGRQHEYMSEAERIVPLLESSPDLESFTLRVHQVFKEMFDERIAGDIQGYQALSAEIYGLRRST